MTIGIIGVGFVGQAIQKSLSEKNVEHVIYDKYKKMGTLEACLNTCINFLCLPTLFDKEKQVYNKEAIYETCHYFQTNNYHGILVIKSTVEPGTTETLQKTYPTLKFVHNPEFLTAKTAFYDFHHQTHVVLGMPLFQKEEKNILVEFYEKHYPKAEISICSSSESECVKLFCNCFYATKVQFFTELQQLCQGQNYDFDMIKNLMLKNNWIHPMHTTVPGPDGHISYGGMCFPKDTNALLSFMKQCDTPHEVLNAVVRERNEMRQD